MGGEIWLIPHRLSANRRGSLSGPRRESGAELSRRWGREPQAELGELAGVDRRGRPGQRVRAAGGLRERDHVADRVAPRDQRTTRSMPSAMPPCGGAP
jgi:hypothetical protein